MIRHIHTFEPSTRDGRAAAGVRVETLVLEERAWRESPESGCGEWSAVPVGGGRVLAVRLPLDPGRN